MSLDLDLHRPTVDEVIRLLRSRIPEAELYELGALLMSAGSFLVASAIPEMKPQLVPYAELAHQLLTQKKDAEDFRTLDRTPTPDRGSD